MPDVYYEAKGRDMKGVRKDMFEELEQLRTQLRKLLCEDAGERRRTRELLLDSERKIEDRFAKLASFQTKREEMGKKFRKRVAHAVARPVPKRTSAGDPDMVSSALGAVFSSLSERAKNLRFGVQGKQNISNRNERVPGS